jgi:hypothetical protein
MADATTATTGSITLVFHHADGHLIGEPSRVWLRHHFRSCWDDTTIPAQPQFILQHVICHRPTYQWTAAGKLAPLTWGEAVQHILLLYQAMAWERQQRAVMVAAAAATATTASMMVGGVAYSAPHEGGGDTLATTTATATTPAAPETTEAAVPDNKTIMPSKKLQYIQSLQRLKRLLQEKERLQTRRDVYELAIARVRWFLDGCHRHRPERRPQNKDATAPPPPQALWPPEKPPPLMIPSPSPEQEQQEHSTQLKVIATRPQSLANSRSSNSIR